MSLPSHQERVPTDDGRSIAVQGAGVLRQPREDRQCGAIGLFHHQETVDVTRIFPALRSTLYRVASAFRYDLRA